MPPPRASRPKPVISVQFHATKYGPELLIDVAWIHDIATFLLADPHRLHFYDITLITSGRGTFTLDGTPYPVKAGSVCFTTPGEVRHWDVTGLDGICVFFPGLFLAEFFNDPLFLERMPFFHAAPGGGVVDLPLRSARAFRKELEGMQHDLHPLRSDTIHLLRARLYQELVKLARRYRTIRGDDDLPAPHPVTSRYRALVERNASRWHGVAEYARELAVSPGYLNTLCRRHLGRNAKELITHQLVLEARRQLCYSRRSAAEIARALGFKDPSYFSRFLVQQTGRSPRHFRTEQDLLARNPSRYTREQLIETRRA